ncbi:hypothetical protein HY486_02665 [Candidatus Woesearchaeota archaeon]|nr:hypothetical protein [Candidatus Woesearchaeota archaeon]
MGGKNEKVKSPSLEEFAERFAPKEAVLGLNEDYFGTISPAQEMLIVALRKLLTNTEILAHAYFNGWIDLNKLFIIDGYLNCLTDAESIMKIRTLFQDPEISAQQVIDVGALMVAAEVAYRYNGNTPSPKEPYENPQLLQQWMEMYIPYLNGRLQGRMYDKAIEENTRSELVKASLAKKEYDETSLILQGTRKEIATTLSDLERIRNEHHARFHELKRIENEYNERDAVLLAVVSELDKKEKKKLATEKELAQTLAQLGSTARELSTTKAALSDAKEEYAITKRHLAKAHDELSGMRSDLETSFHQPMRQKEIEIQNLQGIIKEQTVHNKNRLQDIDDAAMQFHSIGMRIAKYCGDAFCDESEAAIIGSEFRNFSEKTLKINAVVVNCMWYSVLKSLRGLYTQVDSEKEKTRRKLKNPLQFFRRNQLRDEFVVLSKVSKSLYDAVSPFEGIKEDG